MLGFSKSFAKSVAPDVRVNVPLPRLDRDRVRARAPTATFRAQVAAVDAAAAAGARRRTSPRAAVWLASPAAAFITGQAINVNGGVVG